jgi:hypothetical protein
MFLLHFDALLSFRCTYVEKDHLILQEHLSGEGTSFPSGAPKWRCSFSTKVLLKDKMFLLHLGTPNG